MISQPSRPPRRALLALTALLSTALALPACRREEVTHFRVNKPTEATRPARAPTAMTGMAPGDVPPPPAPAASNAIHWKLPKGWTQTPGSAMRFATLKPPAQGRIDVSVVVLPGEAGGELANVNRWRGQIGLAPIDGAALGKARQEIGSKAGPFSLYDFTSEGNTKSRMVTALAVVEGNTWFIKMMGDAGPVGASRPDFLQLLRSVSRDGAK